jgi:hypothetical protein
VLPSLADVAFAAVLFFAFFFGAHSLLNSDGDAARHLAVGREILDTRAIPRTDFFSHTRAGAPFVAYEWLGEVAFAAADRAGGLVGVEWLAAALIALPFLLLGRWMVRDGTHAGIAVALVAAGALASTVHWLARPHLFSVVLALFWSRALARFEETADRRYLIPLPFAMVAWVNLHPGFLAGFILLAVYLAGNARRRDRALPIVQVVGASLLATLINPFGARLWPYVLGYVQRKPLLDQIQEFQSPNLHEPAPKIFLLLALLALLAMALAPRRARGTDVLLLLVWTYLGLYSVRNIALFVVVCLPVVGRVLQTWLGDAPSRLTDMERRMGRPLLPAALAGLALFLQPHLSPAMAQTAFEARTFPVEAVPKLASLRVQGRLFNYYAWGGYLEYAARLKYPVFVDGQTDHYGLELINDYQHIWQLGPEWRSLLECYGVSWALIPHDSPLSLMLAQTPPWARVYEDSTADVWVRR